MLLDENLAWNKIKMVKKTWLIGLAILTVGLWSSLGCGKKSDFKSRSEPDSFRGIKWGTDIKTLSDMEYSFSFSAPTSIFGPPESWYEKRGEVYTRKGDSFVIGRAYLKKIKYYFWEGKFYKVEVTTGDDSADGLGDALVEKFGKGNRGNYEWSGNKVEMSFSPLGRRLTMVYKKISKQIEIYGEQKIKEWEAYKKEKAKEGAEKGF